jgi:predicted site-specific integrase-resolvase
VGVNEHVACRWFREGTLLVPARRAGKLILVDGLRNYRKTLKQALAEDVAW